MEWELDWDNIYRTQGEVQRDILPTALIASELFKRKGINTVLDLGCGTGRHAAFFAGQGFKVIAADISEKAVEITKNKAAALGLDIKTINLDMRKMPFEDDSFDAVFCIWTTGHGLYSDAVKHADEMMRVVRKNGLVFADYVSKDDELYGVGQEIEKDTFINADLPGEEDIPHHYSDEKELRELYKGYKMELRLYTYSYDSCGEKHYIKANVVICEK